jgi:hypothetical protein
MFSSVLCSVALHISLSYKNDNGGFTEYKLLFCSSVSFIQNSLHCSDVLKSEYINVRE